MARRHETPDIAVAAIEATTQLLEKGSYVEHQKLIDVDVFSVALELHSQPSQRQYSIKLLHAIVSNLSDAILIRDDLARKMISLFESVKYSIFHVSLTKTSFQ